MLRRSKCFTEFSDSDSLKSGCRSCERVEQNWLARSPESSRGHRNLSLRWMRKTALSGLLGCLRRLAHAQKRSGGFSVTEVRATSVSAGSSHLLTGAASPDWRSASRCSDSSGRRSGVSSASLVTKRRRIPTVNRHHRRRFHTTSPKFHRKLVSTTTSSGGVGLAEQKLSGSLSAFSRADRKERFR